MKKEQFISSLTKLFPECPKAMSQTWAKSAEENVEREQFVNFKNPNNNEKAVADWLESIYAGIALVKQQFNIDIAKQIVELYKIPFCLYPHEMYYAAKHFESGGQPEGIKKLSDEGLLDLTSADDWPEFPTLEVLAEAE